MAPTLTDVAARVVQDAGYSSAALCPWYYNAGATTDAKAVKIYNKIREADRQLRQWFRIHAADDLLLEHGIQVVGGSAGVEIFDPWVDTVSLYAGLTQSRVMPRSVIYSFTMGVPADQDIIMFAPKRPLYFTSADIIEFKMTCNQNVAAGALRFKVVYADGITPAYGIQFPAMTAGVEQTIQLAVLTQIDDVAVIKIQYKNAIGTGNFTLTMSNAWRISNRIINETKLTTIPCSPDSPGRILYVEDANGNEVPIVGVKSSPLLRLAQYKLASGVMQPNTSQARTNYRLFFPRPGYVALLPSQSESKTLWFYYIADGGEYTAGAYTVNGPAWYIDLLVAQAIILCYQKLSGRPSDVQQRVLDMRLMEYLRDPGYGDTENELIVEEPWS